MKKSLLLLSLAASTWLAATGCGPSVPEEGGQAAGFDHGASSVAAASESDAMGIVTRRLLAGLEWMPMGSPSPDGKYVSDNSWEGSALVIRDLQTGEERPITEEEDEEWTESSRISPDGRWVAYTLYEDNGATDDIRVGIRVIPMAGGESRVLVGNEYQYAQTFDWSADGSRILVGLTRFDSTTQIALVDVEDTGMRVVKSVEAGKLGQMALSPDGRHVAYDTQREEGSPEHTVHVVGTDGGGDRDVTGPGGHNVVLGWEPSGHYLLYYGDHSGSPSVWALPVREGRPQGEPVLVRSDLWHMIPVGFSADGDFLYGVATGKVDVFTVLTDPETGAPIGEPQSVTPNYQAGSALFSKWAPDGRYLAYRRTPPSVQRMSHNLVIRGMETGEFREIALNLEVVVTPDWSTDGRFLIAWAREGYARGTNKEGMYRIDVQTGEHGFVHTIGGDLRGVAWLDDGRTVVYKEVLDEGPPPGWCRFVTLELATGREREISRWHCHSKDWWWALSPDKHTIAGVFDNADNPAEDPWTLRLVSLADGASRDLATFYPWIGDNSPGNMPVSGIFWTPDSRSFRWRGCFSPDQLDKAKNRCPNWSFDVVTGELRRLSDDAPMGSIHPDGRRVAFSDGETAYEVWVMEGYLSALEGGGGRGR